MNVVFQYQGLVTEAYKTFFRENTPEDIQLIFIEERGDEPLLALAEEADVLVGYKLSKEFMEKAINLRHIQIPWTGFNNFGAEHLHGRDHITVSNSHSNSLAIAEHAVALLFAASKLLPHRDSEMRKGDWTTRYTETNSFWVTGKKLGIIGYGAIGKQVAGMLKVGFSMKVLAIKRNPGEKDENVDFIGGMNDLKRVLKDADFILIALPLTSETEGLIKSKHFEMMKSNAVIINIARGPIIDEESLYKALKEGKIGAAGIDTWYNYPKGDQRIVEQNFPFHELKNIVMTPHSAFKIRDREEIFALDILTNIRLVHENKDPINQVDLKLGY